MGGGRQGGAKADVSTSASLAFAKLIVAAQLIRPAEKVPVVKEPLPGGDNDRFAKIFERLAKLPAGHKPRAGDFASAVWEFGREALVKLEEQKRTEIVFGDKYHKLSWSKEHPILTAVYERYRECWAVMGLSFYEMRRDPSGRMEAFNRALDARKHARSLMDCLWLHFGRDVESSLCGKGLSLSTPRRGRPREGLRQAIEAWELKLLEPDRKWTWPKLAERFCIYEGRSHVHEKQCHDRLKQNVAVLKRKLRQCGVSLP